MIRNLSILAVCLYAAMILLFLFANWWRNRLLRWSKQELKWLGQESEELYRMRKHLVQQFEWESTRAYHGNVVMNAAYEARRKEFNRRREKLLAVTWKAQKLLPW